MRQVTLTVKISPEVLADLDAYAEQEFLMACPSCAGEGYDKRDQRCERCNGRKTVGNRSEAARFLLMYGLGDRASPEARAMMTLYASTSPIIVSRLNKAAHDATALFRDAIIAAIHDMGLDGR